MQPRPWIPLDERERWKTRLRAWMGAEAEIAGATLWAFVLGRAPEVFVLCFDARAARPGWEEAFRAGDRTPDP